MRRQQSILLLLCAFTAFANSEGFAQVDSFTVYRVLKAHPDEWSFTTTILDPHTNISVPGSTFSGMVDLSTTDTFRISLPTTSNAFAVDSDLAHISFIVGHQFGSNPGGGYVGIYSELPLIRLSLNEYEVHAGRYPGQHSCQVLYNYIHAGGSTESGSYNGDTTVMDSVWIRMERVHEQSGVADAPPQSTVSLYYFSHPLCTFTREARGTSIELLDIVGRVKKSLSFNSNRVDVGDQLTPGEPLFIRYGSQVKRVLVPRE